MSRHTFTAVGLSLTVVLTACGSGKESAAPTPTSSSTTTATPASSGPLPREWLAGLASDGTTLYVTTHSCPGKVAAGTCTIKGPSRSLKAFPLSLWRYADGSWEELSQPGVFSYSSLFVLPGGLLFVSRTEGGSTTSPLRVSADAGRTWQDWHIPQRQRGCHSPDGGGCQVGVAGEDVVVAGGHGWIRRRIRTGGWEEITLPKRARMNEHDDGAYGFLALADGALVATVNADAGRPGGYYRVSRDGGATWSGPHANPGKSSQVDLSDGSAVYATCWKLDSVSKNGTSASSCGMYRSTDLQRWRKATAAEEANVGFGPPVACRRVYQREGPSRRLTEAAVRVGELVFAIAYVPYVDGREATSKQLAHLDLPHRARHVLEQSADRCRTWSPVLGG